MSCACRKNAGSTSIVSAQLLQADEMHMRTLDVAAGAAAAAVV
jgi:hypothetical protein